MNEQCSKHSTGFADLRPNLLKCSLEEVTRFLIYILLSAQNQVAATQIGSIVGVYSRH